MYAQVCTHLDLEFIIGMLGINPVVDHWKASKRVMQYLQRIKYYILTYWKSNQLEIIGYSDSDFAGCQDNKKSTSGYFFLLVGDVIF